MLENNINIQCKTILLNCTIKWMPTVKCYTFSESSFFVLSNDIKKDGYCAKEYWNISKQSYSTFANHRLLVNR